MTLTRHENLLVPLGLVLLAGCASYGKPAPDPAALTPPPGGDLIGRVEIYEATSDDTLIELARTHNLGYVELAAANPDVDPWLPGAGAKLVIPQAHILPPGPREGVVINLAEQRLYFFNGSTVPVSYPIGVGREGSDTPLGTTEIVRMAEAPTWYPPASAREEDPTLENVVPPGPDNPLGSHALYLGWPQYLVHGTNEPYGIGRRVSRGCIRLYPEDIVDLYAAVETGTAVTVIDEPIKLGTAGGELYLEAHPSLAQALQLEETGTFHAEAVPTLKERVLAAAGPAAARLDWGVIDEAVMNRAGVPVQITRTPDRPTGHGGVMDLFTSMTDEFNAVTASWFGDQEASN